MTERHVRPNKAPEGGWVVRNESVEFHTTTQGEAVDHARQTLRTEGGGTLYVHSTDGSVREERSVD